MFGQAKLQLEGTWTVDVYKGDGTLRERIGPQSNFITQTGLSMIMDYAIADCFRYLSLGSGTTKNSIVFGSATTGLQLPGREAYYIGGRREESDPSHTTSCYSAASFKESLNTVTLSRGWRVPSGEEVFQTNLTFREFMLSPGRPFVTGIEVTATDNNDWSYYTYTRSTNGSNTNITVTPNNRWTPTNKYVNDYAVFLDGDYNFQQAAKILASTNNVLTVEGYVPGTHAYVNIHPLYKLCHCSEYATDILDPENWVHGQDYTATADEYQVLGRPICAQTGAFVRVTGTIPVTMGDYLILNYDLKVTIDSGIQGFQIAPTSRAATKDNKQDTIGVNYPYPDCVEYQGNWIPIYYGETYYVSGLSAPIHHGLKLINPGAFSVPSPWYSDMPQMSTKFSAASDYGEGFVSSWGCPFEPYLSSPYLSAYISNDWLQFAVSPVGGGTGSYGSRSGLMGWRNTPYTDCESEFNPAYFNIRMPNSFYDLGSQNLTPNPRNYTDSSSSPGSATGYLGYNIQFATTTTNVSVVKENYAALYGATSRMRSIQRNLEFLGNVIATHDGSTPAGFDMTTVPIRALVLSYVVPGYQEYHFPYFDVGFAGVRLASYFTPLPNYPNLRWLLTGEDSNAVPPLWNYLQDNAKLTYWFKLYWTAPCSADVDGCT